MPRSIPPCARKARANGRIWLVDDAVGQESALAEREEAGNRLDALQDALGLLNERERRIFEAQRLPDDPMTLGALSAEFGISRERVRQIEVRAFEKVQSSVKAYALVESR
jgi:RNA polymerase sigma-32 factor